MKRSPTTVILGSPDWRRAISRGYDHVHWSRINAEELDPKMGTISDSTAEGQANTGLVVLLGRRADGSHHQLYGPITPTQYHALQTVSTLPAS